MYTIDNVTCVKGSLHESYSHCHICVTYGSKKDRTDPSVGRSRPRGYANAAPRTSGHAAAPTEAREDCSGSGERPVLHARSSMVESTADDHLTVDGDANVCAGAKQKVSAGGLGVIANLHIQ